MDKTNDKEEAFVIDGLDTTNIDDVLAYFIDASDTDVSEEEAAAYLSAKGFEDAEIKKAVADAVERYAEADRIAAKDDGSFRNEDGELDARVSPEAANDFLDQEAEIEAVDTTDGVQQDEFETLVDTALLLTPEQQQELIVRLQSNVQNTDDDYRNLSDESGSALAKLIANLKY